MDPQISQDYGPILEGIDSGFGDPGACVFFVPEVAYVQQGDKALFFKGEQALCESVEDTMTIVESLDDLEIVEVLDERTGKTRKVVKGGQWFVEGPYQRSGVKNANGREYALKIWERIVGDPDSPTQQAVKAGGMLGHLEHPKDGRMDGREGALVTRSLKLRSDGVVWGVSELLDTPHGLTLQEYTRRGIRWGVSSRGNGSVSDTGKVNETDYELVTFDAVMRPSTPGAYPKRIDSGKGSKPSESADGSGSLTEEAEACLVGIQSLQETDLEALDETTRAKFAAALLDNLSRVNSLGRSNGLSDKKVTELQDWLIRTLRESQEVSDDSVEVDLEELLANVSTDDDPEQAAAFQRVVAELQQQLDASANEAEDLRAELETARLELGQARAENVRVNSQRESFKEDLEDARSELERVRSKLSIAEDVLSERSTVEVADAKQQAVEEAITQVEGLEQFRTVLEGAEDAVQVFELAEELLPAVAAKRQQARQAATPPAPINRRALPQPGMLVESDVRGGAQRSSTSPSRGARVAGGALKRMGTSKAKAKAGTGV
jgi:hypothetical protein